MRLVKALCVVIFGPIVGAVLGFFVGGILLPPDPTGRGSPGDGLVIFRCAGWSLLILVFPSVLIALWIIRRPAQLDNL